MFCFIFAHFCQRGIDFLERGRRNAVVVTTDSLKDMDDISEREKEELEAKEKNDLGSEKKEGEKESIDSEEKEKDSEESKEVSSKVKYL